MASELAKSDLEPLADALRAALDLNVQIRQPLARYTAFRIGGPADLLVVADQVTTLRQAVALAWDQNVPCRILGGGCNVLVSDAGVRGLVVLNRARAITFPPRPTLAGGEARNTQHGTRRVRAESGASFSTVAQRCVAQGLAGLEWASGIPGTVGGAVVGNAGAWGSDVASTLTEATLLEPGGVVVKWPAARLEYSYRQSVLKRRTDVAERAVSSTGSRPKAVVLEAEFAVRKGDRESLRARVAEIAARRKATQPPGATCGSVFKNPPGDFAGRLIEAAGLKGQRRGDAEISGVHANFIVNRGQATATDVKSLIDLMGQTVQTRFGVTLELEIELVGSW
jgi:UDP-N-acetylmuramate dehydrogenase